MQKLLFFILFSLMAFGCRKNELINKVIVDEAKPVVLVVSSFKGKVVDDAGLPVSGAVVRISQNVTITDAQGQFKFQNIKAPKGGALVSVTKNGFFIGSAMAGNSAKGQNYVQVTLQDKGVPQKVSATAGGVLAWPDGSKVTIKPNSLKLASGTTYSGDVNVYAKWLDPTDPDLADKMPGALMARDAEGNEKVLATYGMMALELESLSGDLLEIKDGESADLDIPIPASLEATAPADIPLWYFDLEEERWLLKGTCIHTGGGGGGGGYYHCTVLTTGYWNCDIALVPICLSGTIFQSDTTPAYYTKVIVEDLTDNFIYYGYTDINGFFCGSVPQGANLKITIQDLCNNILYEQNIGPYAQDFNLGDIYLATTLSQYLIHIYGQLLDCAGAPVTTGQVSVQYPGKIRLFPLTSPGVFDFQMALNCIEFPDLFISGYDLTNFKATALQNQTDLTDINLGVLTACTDPTDFFNLTVGTDTYHAAPTRFFLKNNVTTNWMVLEALTTGGTFTLDLQQYSGVGQYTVNTQFSLANKLDAPDYPALSSASPDVTVTITADDGSFISGNITGTAYDTFGVPSAINGSFNIKKGL